MKRLSTQCMNEIENKTNRNRKERKTKENNAASANT